MNEINILPDKQIKMSCFIAFQVQLIIDKICNYDMK